MVSTGFNLLRMETALVSAVLNFRIPSSVSKLLSSWVSSSFSRSIWLQGICSFRFPYKNSERTSYLSHVRNCLLFLRALQSCDEPWPPSRLLASGPDPVTFVSNVWHPPCSQLVQLDAASWQQVCPVEYPVSASCKVSSLGFWTMSALLGSPSIHLVH